LRNKIIPCTQAPAWVQDLKNGEAVFTSKSGNGRLKIEIEECYVTKRELGNKIK
jgi:hypothetical protein